jgi:N-sulfoglucosamine sulfohydrolase
MKFRIASLIPAFLLGLLAFIPSAFPAQPNIVWILGDDLGPELACYGDPLVKTPNLDKLAAEGIRFTNAHTTGPVCSASRSAMITGIYQTTTGTHNHRSHRNDGYKLPDGVVPFTDLLRTAGYYTVNLKSADGLGVGKTDFNFNIDHPVYDGKDWSERKKDQPFFAIVNFNEPHRGPSWPQARKQLPKVELIDPAKVKLPPYYPDTPLARDDWANYLDAIHNLDRKIGRILQRLKDEGIADNTIVFFLGDNGRCHVRDKQWVYDGGTHIPLIVRWPGHFKAGEVRDDLLVAIDFTATTLKLAGVDPPANVQGRVFLGEAAAPPRPFIVTARDRCDETEDRIRCVRTKEFSYIRNYFPDRPYTQPNAYKERQYPVLQELKDLHKAGKLTPEQEHFMAAKRPAEELYDLKADPHEVHNLAADPMYDAKRKEMGAILDNWIKETHDQGEKPEEPLAKSK